MQIALDLIQIVLNIAIIVYVAIIVYLVKLNK